MINDSFLPSLTDERPLRVCWLTASTARRVQARTQGLQRLIESAMPSLDGLPAVPHMTTNPIADWASLWAKFRNDRAPREVRKLAPQWHEQGVSRPWLMEFYLGTREAWDPQALAKRLGITPAEAKRVLYMTGREEELPTGMWVRGKSPDAQLLRGGWEAIINGDPSSRPSRNRSYKGSCVARRPAYGQLAWSDAEPLVTST